MTDLTKEEREKLEGLRATPSPPERLERKTLEALQARGLLRSGRRWHWLYVAAAFLVGLLLGSSDFAREEPGYVLLLEGGESATVPDEERRVREYAAWAGQLRDEGVTITGERIVGDLRRIGGTDSARADIRGYFVFEAVTEDEALEIASTCPHLRYEGAVLLGRLAR